MASGQVLQVLREINTLSEDLSPQDRVEFLEEIADEIEGMLENARAVREHFK